MDLNNILLSKKHIEMGHTQIELLKVVINESLKVEINEAQGRYIGMKGVLNGLIEKMKEREETKFMAEQAEEAMLQIVIQCVFMHIGIKRSLN